MKDFEIKQGDCLAKLREIEEGSIDTIVTSPPYFLMRDYGEEGQMGLEDNSTEYIESLLKVFTECKRVLRDTGSLWINIRDTYSKGLKKSGVKNKSLSMIPERLAIRLLDDGWILRNDIIWHKPNAMPDSAKDRFTVDYEHLYFFTKKDKYYFNTAYEPFVTKKNTKVSNSKKNSKQEALLKTGMVRHGAKGTTLNDPSKWSDKGRIKRTTWSINTKTFKGAHFAVFPKELIHVPITSGCPAQGTVLDPFCGSGTTGEVSIENNMKFIGIELNPEYIKIAKERISNAITLRENKGLVNENEHKEV